MGGQCSAERATVDVYIPSDPDFGMLLTVVEPYLKRPSEFVLLAQLKRLDQYPKPGHYVLKHGMSNLALVEQPQRQRAYCFKFNNQERLEDLVGTLSRQIEPDSLELLMAFKNQEFLTKAQMNSETFDALCPQFLRSLLECQCGRYWSTYVN